jgi:hypothetical protein
MELAAFPNVKTSPERCYARPGAIAAVKKRS